MSTTTIYRTAVWPSLLYRDANAAIAFLVDAFGFEKAAVYRNEDGSLVEHAELRWPEGGGVILGSARPDSGIAELPPGGGAVSTIENATVTNSGTLEVSESQLDLSNTTISGGSITDNNVIEVTGTSIVNGGAGLSDGK